MSEEQVKSQTPSKEPKAELAVDVVAGEEKKTVRRSKKKSVISGCVYVNAGFNNTIVTITDSDGKALSWATAGSCGFKGSKKATPFAAQMAAENAAEKAKAYGFEKADVYVNGVGHGREQALRGLIAQGIAILKIVDVTPIPHNGCRKPRIRRV
ncbi:MAG: 30S ribosomal protein S11 [Candidatus Gracilibacteria bacterium]